MTILEMLGQSGQLTLLGMGVVFGFLILLVIVVSITGKIIGLTGGNAASEGAPITGAPANAGGNVTAAISAAVKEYQKNN
jgi:oxaloacetate decarboxylase gamma subunit